MLEFLNFLIIGERDCWVVRICYTLFWWGKVFHVEYCTSLRMVYPSDELNWFNLGQ